MRKTCVIAFFSLFISACTQFETKDAVYVSPLAGKLKLLQRYNDSTELLLEEYQLHYDSISGDLLKLVRNAEDCVILSRLNSSVIKLYCHYGSGIEVQEFDLYAYLNAYGYIKSIISYNPEVENADGYYFKFSGDKIDTITERSKVYIASPIFRLYNVHYDMQSDGRNYTSITTRAIRKYWNVSQEPDTFNYQTYYTYATCAFDPAVPYQGIFSNTWDVGGVDPVYILGLAGYEPYKQNRNMIGTVNGYQYIYVFDANNRVVEFRRQFSPQEVYRLTYY